MLQQRVTTRRALPRSERYVVLSSSVRATYLRPCQNFARPIRSSTRWCAELRNPWLQVATSHAHMVFECYEKEEPINIAGGERTIRAVGSHRQRVRRREKFIL